MWYGIEWCGAVRCSAVQCGAVCCSAMLCGAVRCGSMVWCCLVPSGLVWCGVAARTQARRGNDQKDKKTILIFGVGYSGERLAGKLLASGGWSRGGYKKDTSARSVTISGTATDGGMPSRSPRTHAEEERP